MNRILKKILQRGVDLSPVGVELREDILSIDACFLFALRTVEREVS